MRKDAVLNVRSHLEELGAEVKRQHKRNRFENLNKFRCLWESCCYLSRSELIHSNRVKGCARSSSCSRGGQPVTSRAEGDAFVTAVELLEKRAQRPSKLDDRTLIAVEGVRHEQHNNEIAQGDHYLNHGAHRKRSACR
jgi:hypothetical protein